MSWTYVRVHPDRIGIVRHPGTGEPVTPDPRRPYRSDDPLVTSYPDMFVSDQELAGEHQSAESAHTAEIPTEPPAEPPVERATRAPGERRHTRRR